MEYDTKNKCIKLVQYCKNRYRTVVAVAVTKMTVIDSILYRYIHIRVVIINIYCRRKITDLYLLFLVITLVLLLFYLVFLFVQRDCCSCSCSYKNFIIFFFDHDNRISWHSRWIRLRRYRRKRRNSRL